MFCGKDQIRTEIRARWQSKGKRYRYSRANKHAKRREIERERETERGEAIRCDKRGKAKAAEQRNMGNKYKDICMELNRKVKKRETDEDAAAEPKVKERKLK